MANLFVAHVMPLWCGARRLMGKQYSATTAVFVHKKVFNMPSAPEIIARFYDLTPSELRVLLSIAQAGGVSETAEILGVADSTIRTHLNRLFAKTGTMRQAELVKLLAAFSSPLRNAPRTK
jgi:DNA-binding CsgD family transcriptional regulator